MTSRATSLTPEAFAESVVIAVLIPCHDEALAIARVVSGFREHLPTASIFVYDNRSTDGTAEVARA